MRKVTLGDVLNVKRGASLSGQYYSTEGNLIRLTLGNFNYPGGGFKENTAKEDIFFNGPIKPEFVLNKGDIITPLTEQVSGLLGETATIPESNKYIQSGDVGLVIPNESMLDRRFAYYLVSSPIVKKQLDAAAQQTKIRHTSPDAIKACKAWIPEEITVQASIGRLLDSMNYKIANNNAICSTLETMAKTIYDYWFVQFDFPDENGKPYKSSGGKMVWNEELKREIPEGWEVRKLKNLYTIQRGVSYTSKDIEIEEGIPMLNLACFDTDRNYRDGELKYYSGKLTKDIICNAGDMLIACTDLTRNADIVGSPILVPDDGNKYIFSMDLAKIHSSCHQIIDSYLYMVLRTDSYHNYIKKWASGTNVLHLDLAGLDWYAVVIPPIRLQTEIKRIVINIHRKKSEILKENQQLASLRDFLLPMLMNGQVRVDTSR